MTQLNKYLWIVLWKSWLTYCVLDLTVCRFTTKCNLKLLGKKIPNLCVLVLYVFLSAKL